MGVDLGSREIHKIINEAMWRVGRLTVFGSRALSMRAVAGGSDERAIRARAALVPLIEKKLDGFVLWFFANKKELEAKARGEACPHHDSLDDCPSRNDPSHACPFERPEEAAGSTWMADECKEVEREVTEAERQLHLLEHALGPYARGERNSFRSSLRLRRKDDEVKEVGSFDALLALYHDEITAQHGADPRGWSSDRDVQRLVLELTTKFLQAAEPDFQTHSDATQRPN